MTKQQHKTYRTISSVTSILQFSGHFAAYKKTLPSEMSDVDKVMFEVSVG